MNKGNTEHTAWIICTIKFCNSHGEKWHNFAIQHSLVISLLKAHLIHCIFVHKSSIFHLFDCILLLNLQAESISGLVQHPKESLLLLLVQSSAFLFYHFRIQFID